MRKPGHHRHCRRALARLMLLPLLAAAATLPATPSATDAARERMVAQQIKARGITDPRVLAAMDAVPRHRFVPPAYQARAYDDTPLPIGHGQTISQPYIVALMTAQLALERPMKVLEIGTGSGYQAAVLAHIVDAVYTIEIVPALAEQAQQRMTAMGYDQVAVRHADGYAGWPEQAPFDAIIVTAAAAYVPPPLLQQLAPGGRMIIPVGSPFGVQRLMLLQKAADGAVRSRDLMPVRFVPFTRQ